MTDYAFRLAELAARFPMTLADLDQAYPHRIDDEHRRDTLIATHAGMAVRWAALLLSEAQSEDNAIAELRQMNRMATASGLADEFQKAMRQTDGVEIMMLDPETGKDVQQITVRWDVAQKLLVDGARYRLIRSDYPNLYDSGKVTYSEPMPQDGDVHPITGRVLSLQTSGDKTTAQYVEPEHDVSVSGPDADSIARVLREGGLVVKTHGDPL